MKLTIQQARRYILNYHGLLGDYQWQGKEGIMQVFNRVHCIQYDPLSIIDTNPNLVLQARIRDYRSNYLQELLYQDRLLLDGWDKNMSIFSVSDWPYFSRLRQGHFKNYRNNQAVLDYLPTLRKKILTDGPISSIDFRNQQKIDWYWSPTTLAKAGLEYLFWNGELIVHHRMGTRRYYDFTHRHLDQQLITIKDPFDDDRDYYRWFIKRRVEAVGLLWKHSSDAFLGIKGMKRADKTKALKELVDAREIITLKVEGFAEPLYAPFSSAELLEKAITGAEEPKAIMRFLAPLDNMLWDRKLIAKLFEFNYVWEVYKPAAKRQYGYYVLPILYGNQLIGRVEPVYQNRTGTLEVRNWWWESDLSHKIDLQRASHDAVARLAEYLGASRIIK